MKAIKYFILFLILSFLLANNHYISAQEDINDEVKKINKEIQDNKDTIKKLQEKQSQYTQALRKKQMERSSLTNQLAILDNRIAKAEIDIETAETEITITDLEVKKVNSEINSTSADIDSEKNHLAYVLRLMQKQDQAGLIEVIISNNNLSDFLNQIKYLENINDEVGKSVADLSEYKTKLESDLALLDKKNEEQKELKKDLEEKKIQLEDESNNKVNILELTRSSEKEYQRLIQLAKEEQEQVASDIATMEKLVREKMTKASGKELEFNDAGFIWPVPKNTITSFFHDPDYPFRYIFEHPAIDIRAGQGTEIKAAASGYIARAKNAGVGGYSYIMLIHGDGLATVYGHVLKIYVEEDEYVTQGQTIALTGGLPGTPGAGRLTTGPHLHFEVRLNGIPVNALEYLP